MFKKTSIDQKSVSSTGPAPSSRMVSESRPAPPSNSANKGPNAPHAAQSSAEVSREAIAKLAFQKWQKRGCPPGEDQRDWFEAERELKSSQTAKTRR